MAALNHADALIFDLRDNRGGYTNMVVFLASYLFDHPEYMFNPRDPITEQTWTRCPVAGSLLVDNPIYILISSRTYSGAEQFRYDLKMLKRATLIGETTGGASHYGVLHNLDDHFAVGVPEHRPVNPFFDKDWAITGIEPM
ncbi:MAG: S41 family peptidase [Acidobacteriia bacterium]|nr:S41 family peptidase [Terriglobia bacterium]